MTTIHAHVATSSADCDGRYDYSTVYTPDEGETDAEFIEWTVENFVSGPTEEGFVHHTVTICREDDADERGTFRDHTAEAAGY